VMNLKAKQKYMLSVVEEAIMNPDLAGYRGGRIEVIEGDSPYSRYEGRFLLPEEIYEKFREALDFYEGDKRIYIKMDYPDEVAKEVKKGD